VKFPYKQFPDGKGGSRYHAVIPVYIALSAKNAPRSKRVEAYVDSGASRTLFHSGIGRAVGFEIEKGELEETIGITGVPVRIYVHDVALYAPGGVIQVRAGFCDALPVAGLLGMVGFFDHFKVTFDPTARQCDLERVYQT